MIIDFRCRPPFGGFLDPNLCDLFIAENVTGFSKRFGMTVPPSALQKDMGLFLREMDEAGVDKAVVPIRFSPGGLATGSSRDLHMDNDDLIRLHERYGNRIIGVVGMDLLNADASIDMIEKYVLHGPCKAVIVEPGFRFNPTVPDDKSIYPIYAHCQKEHVPLLLSCGGFTAPSHRYLKPEYIENVAGDFPDLKIAVGHAAWPWVTEISHVAFKCPNVYISPDLYLMNVPGSRDYAAAANYWIPEKVLFGSAYPVTAMKDAVALHRSVIREEVIDDVLGNNAARFFGL